MRHPHNGPLRASGRQLARPRPSEGTPAGRSLRLQILGAGVLAVAGVAVFAMLDSEPEVNQADDTAPVQVEAQARVAEPKAPVVEGKQVAEALGAPTSDAVRQPAAVPPAVAAAAPAPPPPAPLETFPPAPPPAVAAPLPADPPAALAYAPPPAPPAPAAPEPAPPAEPVATAALDTPQPPPSAAPAATPALGEGLVTAAKNAPTDCLPPELVAVLADVAARFGPVTTVSTSRLNTDNHSPGSVRDKLHGACKAVDFKVQGRLEPVLAYLRTRKEVNGINSYRNRLIHIDFNERHAVAGAPAPVRRRAWPRPVEEEAPASPSPAAPAAEPVPFSPALPDVADRGAQGQ